MSAAAAGAKRQAMRAGTPKGGVMSYVATILVLAGVVAVCLGIAAVIGWNREAGNGDGPEGMA